MTNEDSLLEESKQPEGREHEASVFWPARIAAFGLALGLWYSRVLWTNIGRTLPVCGLIDSPLSPALDQVLFGLVLVCSLSIVFNKLKLVSTIVLFVSIVLLILLDLNRFQPWLYEYLIILFLCSLPDNTFHLSSADCTDKKLQSVSIVLVAIYFFSGLEKLNWQFFTAVGPWLLGFSQAPTTTFENNVPLIVASAMMPLGEIALALALLFKQTRILGVCMGLFMHLTIIFILGPQRLNINAAVWPWNLTQMVLLLACFLNVSDHFLLRISVRERLLTALTLTTVCLVIPILGLLQIVDPYPAFAFYTGDIPTGRLMFEKATLEKLPVAVQRVCTYDKAMALWWLDLVDWAYVETGASVYPSKFCLRKISRRFAHDHPGELVALNLLTFPKLTKKIESHFEKNW
jgi:hypothetical protein